MKQVKITDDDYYKILSVLTELNGATCATEEDVSAFISEAINNHIKERLDIENCLNKIFSSEDEKIGKIHINSHEHLYKEEDKNGY